MKKYLLFALFFLLFPVYGSAADEVSIDLILDRAAATLSDSVQVLVRISGSRKTQTRPVIEGVDDFIVSPGGTSSRVKIVNGQVDAGIDYTYYLQPRKTGVFQIGPAKIKINGKQYQSPTRNLSVSKAVPSSGAQQQPLFLTAELSDKEVYVEEQTAYTVRLYRQINVRDISIHLPENDHIVFKQVGDPREYRSVYEGRTYHVLEVTYAVTPSRDGLYLFGPCTMSMTAMQPANRSSRSLFDDPLFRDPFLSFSSGRPVTLESGSLELNVRPLPENGKPPDFSGLVGEFTIESQLEPAVVTAGESATLTVTVSGRGNVARIPDMNLPGLAQTKVYADQPALKVTHGAQGTEGRKIMKWAIVPEKAGQLILPTLSMNYFDPDRDRYRVLETALPALTVLPGKDESVSLGGPNPESRKPAGAVKEAVKALGRDLLPVHSSVNDLMRPARLKPKPWEWRLFSFGPAGVFLAVFGFVRIQRKSSHTRASIRSRKALKTFIRRYHRKNLSAGERLDALRDYLNDRCNLCLGSMTSEEISNILKTRGVGPETRDSLRTYIQTLERAVYSGGKDESADKNKDMVHIMRNIDRELK